ncbi:MAG: hypothetical protein IJ083_12455 [Clostridia bacterium]|nr:hypothetical protein [Clostridia bacterium]
MNERATELIAHTRFTVEFMQGVTAVIVSIGEPGMKDGAALRDIFRAISPLGLKPCAHGGHEAPDMAVTVLTERIEENDDFPKGLYLRNVDGTLWLRGYSCDDLYRFPAENLFAFEMASCEKLKGRNDGSTE